jgi:protease-4
MEMSLETESILDRRRLRRKVGLWRGLAIIAAVGALAAFAYLAAGKQALLGQQQIARVTLTGVITEDRKQLKMLRRIAKADHVKGVLLFINSPGGTTTGAEALFNEIRKVAQAKPVVAQFGTVAASAAYIAGLASDHIVARGNTITGSVGVIMQWPELTGLLDKVGVKMNEIKSGDLKAAPSPFQPLSPDARKVTEEMIADGQRWFIGLVEERRKISIDGVPGLREGRVFLGRAALKHKLVDAIGGEDQAISWMIKERKVKKGLDIVDWEPEKDVRWPLSSAISGVIAATITETATRLGESATAAGQLGTLSVDGLVSIWKPAKN